jgi:hypothetical protein
MQSVPLPTGDKMIRLATGCAETIPIEDLKEHFLNIYFADNIPQKKLDGAINSYANYDRKNETPVLLIDSTIFGSAKGGLLMTDSTLYYSLRINSLFKATKNALSLKDIEYFGPEGPRNENVFKINDETCNHITLTPAECLVLNLFLDKCRKKVFSFEENEIDKLINPEKYSFFLQKFTIEGDLDKEFLYKIHESTFLGEDLKDISNDVYFTTHRFISPKGKISVPYSEIKSIVQYRHKIHGPTPMFITYI